MTRRRDRHAMRAGVILILLLGVWPGTAALGQTPTATSQPANQPPGQTANQPANQPASSVSPETLRFFQEYKRITHLMEQKEISREALAAYDRAVEAVTAGKIDGAFDALEEALNTDIKKDESRVLWAPYNQLIFDQAQFKRGIGFLQNISLKQPKLPHVHTFLASTYGMYAGWLKDRDRIGMLNTSGQSLAEYEVALALDPNSFQALMGHATYLSYVPGKEAVWEAEFRKLIAMRPADLHGFPFISVYYAFVEGLLRSGQDMKARLVLNEALQLYPKSVALQTLDKKLPPKTSE